MRAFLITAILALPLACAAPVAAQLPNCAAGVWNESKAGQATQNGSFHWTVGVHDGVLFLRRTDGFVSGGFHNVTGNKWIGSLDWNGAGVWDHVEIYVDSCSLIRTNQAWWFTRDIDQTQTPSGQSSEYSPQAVWPILSRICRRPKRSLKGAAEIAFPYSAANLKLYFPGRLAKAT